MAQAVGAARSRTDFFVLVPIVALGVGLSDRVPVAAAGAAPPISSPPVDPSAVSASVTQGPSVHVFDTTGLTGGPFYVNDHTVVRARDGAWHLFGIFHTEPFGDDSEVELVHAVADERDPAGWRDAAFAVAPAPYDVALRADRAMGETHLWAPHVVDAGERYVMVYQGGGPSDDRASIRLAESDDLYRWTRISGRPLFEDFCAARDPMLVHQNGAFTLYYTRCESPARRVSGVAYRTSRDLVRWSEPTMALTLGDGTEMPNSGYTESPFVFERDGRFYLSVTSYPIAWDATIVYRSTAPHAFEPVPFTRLRAHAGEWIEGRGGGVFLTHAGPGQRGVWMSPVDLSGW